MEIILTVVCFVIELISFRLCGKLKTRHRWVLDTEFWVPTSQDCVKKCGSSSESSPPLLEGVEGGVQPVGAAQESPFLSHRYYHRWRWAFQAEKPSYFTSAQESHLLSHFHIVRIQHRSKTGFGCFYLFCIKERVTFVIFQNCFGYFFHSLNKNVYDFKKVIFFL